jgi:hypothetical protein
MRLAKPQNRSGRFGEEQNFMSLLGLEIRIVELVAQSFTDYAIPAL